jgi:hypothetical protein
MKPSKFFLLVFTLILPLMTIASEHKHDAAMHTKLELNDGKKWSSDETLRQAMNNIRSNVETALPAIHNGKFTPAQYDALGKEITGQIAFIVQNCKLDPKADEQLHMVIGAIVSGVDTATARQSKHKRAHGVQRIAEALNNYGKYFDHPGWQALQPEH